jgi:hypothetical protein
VAVFWTILTVVLVAVCLLFLLVGPVFAGGKSLGAGSGDQRPALDGALEERDADRLR